MNLYLNKYRIETTRLPGWDYTSPGYYFITICIRDRLCVLGEIRNGKVHLTPAGIIAEKYWRVIPSHFPSAGLDAFIIMPNHMHGIIQIVETPDSGGSKPCHHPPVETPDQGGSKPCHHPPVETPDQGGSKPCHHPPVETPDSGVSTTIDHFSVSPDESKFKNKQWKPGSLGVIINQYKRICTIEIRKHLPSFQWQPRYYDHIIRTEEDLNRIREYIIFNPLKWTEDKYYIT